MNNWRKVVFVGRGFILPGFSSCLCRATFCCEGGVESLCPGAPPSLLPRGAACFSSQDRKNSSGRAQGPGWPSQSWSHDQRTYGMWVVLNIFIHHAHLAFQGQCLWSYCLLLVSLAPNLKPEIVLDGITVGFASLLLCITASKTAQSTCYGSI